MKASGRADLTTRFAEGKVILVGILERMSRGDKESFIAFLDMLYGSEDEEITEAQTYMVDSSVVDEKMLNAICSKISCVDGWYRRRALRCFFSHGWNFERRHQI